MELEGLVLARTLDIQGEPTTLFPADHQVTQDYQSDIQFSLFSGLRHVLVLRRVGLRYPGDHAESGPEEDGVKHQLRREVPLRSDSVHVKIILNLIIVLKCVSSALFTDPSRETTQTLSVNSNLDLISQREFI